MANEIVVKAQSAPGANDYSFPYKLTQASIEEYAYAIADFGAAHPVIGEAVYLDYNTDLIKRASAADQTKPCYGLVSRVTSHTGGPPVTGGTAEVQSTGIFDFGALNKTFLPGPAISAAHTALFLSDANPGTLISTTVGYADAKLMQSVGTVIENAPTTRISLHPHGFAPYRGDELERFFIASDTVDDSDKIYLYKDVESKSIIIRENDGTAPYAALVRYDASIVAGNEIGILYFSAQDPGATTYNAVAKIQAVATVNWAGDGDNNTDDRPTHLEFYAIPAGQNKAPEEAFRLNVVEGEVDIQDGTQLTLTNAGTNTDAIGSKRTSILFRGLSSGGTERSVAAIHAYTGFASGAHPNDKSWGKLELRPACTENVPAAAPFEYSTGLVLSNFGHVNSASWHADGPSDGNLQSYHYMEWTGATAAGAPKIQSTLIVWNANNVAGDNSVDVSWKANTKTGVGASSDSIRFFAYWGDATRNQAQNAYGQTVIGTDSSPGDESPLKICDLEDKADEFVDLVVDATGQVFMNLNAWTAHHNYPCKESDNLLPGEAVVLKDGGVVRATSLNQTNCVGIVRSVGKLFVKNSLTGEVPTAVDPEYTDEDRKAEKPVPEMDTSAWPYMAHIATAGDARELPLAGFKVCNAGGDIEAGDLLVTSAVAGRLQKQDDDIIRSKTVGKAMEAVTFDGSGNADGIYGFLMCG